jgi:hypothetical protein
MICRKGLDICILGFLILSIGCIGCVPMAEIALSPGAPDDLPGCYAIFPAGHWESVHRIEAIIRGGVSSSLLGVTKGEPSERRLHSLLLTPEGFILFDAELQEDRIAIRKAVAPFDSPAFARGLMEDVTLLFLPPQVRPTTWGKETGGTKICRWEGPGGSRTEVRGSMDHGWRIQHRDDQGEVTREVSLKGPFVQGLASHMELRAFKPASYRLRMTLLQASP